MSNALRYIGVGFLALITLIIVAVVALFYTPPGRQFVKAQAEQQIASAINGTASIGDLASGLPGYLRVDDVVINDSAEGQRPLLTAEGLEIAWDPLALVLGSINIKSISLQKARLDRLPAANTDDDTPAKPLALPDHLPAIKIDALTIDRFTLGEAVAGQEATFSARGNAQMKGRALATTLNVTSDDQKDKAQLTADIDLERKGFTINGDIQSAPDGLISTVIGAQGPVAIAIKGREQDQTAIVEVTTGLGTLGNADLTLVGPIKSGSTLTLDARIEPGAQFDDLQDLTGNIVTLSLAATPQDQGARIDIKALQAQAATVQGVVTWADNQDFLADLMTKLNLTITKGRLTALTDAVGDKIMLNGTVKAQANRSAGLYDVAAALTSDGARMSIRDAETNLRSVLRGQLTGEVTIRDFLPETVRDQLSQPLRFSGDIDADSARIAKLSDFSFAAGEAVKGNVSGRLNMRTQALDGTLMTDISPDLFALVLGADNAASGARLRGRIAGTVDAFMLDTELLSPAFEFDGRSYPALAMDANLTGLPALPVGAVFARPQGQTRETATQYLRARIESTEDLIALRNLRYIGTGFELTGASLIDPKSQSIALDLAYAGVANAEPFPGFILSGSATAKGGFGAKVPIGLYPEPDTGSQDRLELSAPQLSVNTLTIEGLKASVAGTVNDVYFDLALSDLLNDGTHMVTDTKVTGALTGNTNRLVTVTRLASNLLGEVNIRNAKPFTIEMGDTTRLADFDLGWGRGGSLVMAGAFSPTRWTGTVAMTDALIPATDGFLDLNLSLDTDAQAPATGTLTTNYRHSGDENGDVPTPTRLSALLDWNGTRLTLTDRQQADTIPLDFSLDLPARLVRGPALSVNMEGALEGRISYDGAVAPLTATIPGPAQGLDGDLRIDLTLEGPTNQPVVNGQAILTDGAYTDLTTGLSLIGLHLETIARSKAGQSEVTFTAGGRGDSQDGEDRFTVDGALTIGNQNTIATDIKVRDLIISATPVTSLQQSGDIRIEGPFTALSVIGALDVTEMNVEIITPPQTGLVPIEVIKKSVYDATPSATGMPQPLPLPNADRQQQTTTPTEPGGGLAALDLAIKADDRLFVRGRGLESEWESDLTVTLLEQDPIALGSITLRKGTFDFTGRRFDVTTGEIIFDKLSPNDPVIDVIAEYETSDGLVAQVRASGRATDLNVELTSTPSRPANEVMALILFGKPADQLSALESIQSAQALATLGGIGPFGGGDAIGSLRNAAGLDLLNIDLDPENGASALTVGKYVADGLFVSATQDVEGKNGSVRIEYEIRDNITVESNVRQDGDQTISANWKKDF